MSSYDYRYTRIKCNGELVIRTTVVGLAAETFLRLAIHDRLGFDALRPDFGDKVIMRDCTVEGRKMDSEILVDVPREASALAIRVALQAVEDLESAGYRAGDAIRPHFDASRKKVGEHDIVAERRSILPRRQKGFSSVDLKIRVITHPHRSLQTFRLQLRKRVAEESKLWAACCAQPRAGQQRSDGWYVEKWAERLVLMVQFSNPDASEWQILRCESIANTKGASWVTLLGWDEPSTFREQ